MIHFNKKTLEKCVICSKVYTKDMKTTSVMLLQCLYFERISYYFKAGWHVQSYVVYVSLWLIWDIAYYYSHFIINVYHSFASLSLIFVRMSNFLKIGQHFHDGCSYHIETSPLICSANQWTDFFMIGTSAMKELKLLRIKDLWGLINLY